MTIIELLEEKAIYFEKITEGLHLYADVKLVLDEKKALVHFKNLRKEYGAGHAFADFYYFRLDEEAKEMVDEILTVEQKSYLQMIKPDSDSVEEEIIFPLEDPLLEIIVKLNAHEILFSTIYFTSGGGRERTTWWGNYEHEYICFRDRK